MTIGTPGLELVDTPAWMADGACRSHDPDLWFVDDGQPATDARSICATCPVMQQCAEYAITRPITHGIWGGTRWKERAVIRKTRGINRPHPAPHQKRRARQHQPGAPRRMPPIPDGLDHLPTIDDQVAVLDAGGFTATQAAEVLHVATRTISRARTRIRLGQPPAKRLGGLTEAVAACAEAGLSITQTAEKLGRPRSSIANVRSRIRSRIRGRQEAAA